MSSEPKITTNAKYGKSGAEALALSNGTVHAAAVKALRVLLVPDTAGWFAQGIEIDYFACGKNMQEAKRNFANGLCLTANEHLLMYGNVNKMLEPIGKDDPIWADFFKLKAEAKAETLDFSTACNNAEKQPEKVAAALNFSAIQFFEGERAAA